MQQKLRIAFIHPDLGIGGAEQLIVNLAVALQDKEHYVKIYTPHHNRNHCFVETQSRIPVEVRGNIIPPSIFGYFVALCAYLRMLLATIWVILFAGGFDVFIVDQVTFGLPLLWLFRRKTIFYCHYPDKLLCVKRSNILKKIYRFFLDITEEICLLFANLVLVNSQFTRDVVKNNFPIFIKLRKQPEILYPAIDFDKFDIIPELSRQDSRLTTHTFFVSLNRFERKKNIKLAIESFAKFLKSLRNKGQDVDNLKLVIAGGYDQRMAENVEHYEELSKLTFELEVTEQVSFKRNISDTERTWLLQNSIAVLYTPENEHFGIVPIEAMYNEAPVIACNSGGPKVILFHNIFNFFLIKQRKVFKIKQLDIYAQLIRQFGVRRCNYYSITINQLDSQENRENREFRCCSVLSSLRTKLILMLDLFLRSLQNRRLIDMSYLIQKHEAYFQIISQFAQLKKTLNKVSFKACFAPLTNTVPSFGFKLYFMKGIDTRQLTKSHQSDFLRFVKEDPLGSSFLVYNQNELKRKVSMWQQTLPWITPYYAIKSNPIEPLLRDIANGPYPSLDCASKGEISLALKHGIQPQNIIYSNSVKNEKDIEFASKRGIKYTTADTIEELIKINRLAPELKILWRLSIPEENPETMATLFSGKFGDDIENLGAAKRRFKQISDMGIKIHGIHFHCGSAQQGSDSFGKAVDLARECIRIGRQFGHPMELLDVGGGFPSGEIHQNALKALKTTENDPLGYRMMAEPGRHFSSNSCYLLFRVMTKRLKQGKICYHVNDSLYHSFNCILMDGISFENQKDQFYDVSHDNIGQQEWTSLFGMTCDGRDIIANNVKMPNNLQVGDWLCMSGMGSYTVGPKSEFNGMKATQRVVQWSGDVQREQVPQGQLQPTI